MKVFSLKSDWDGHVNKDLADIANLVFINDLDPETSLRPLCRKYGDERIYLQAMQAISKLKAMGA